MNINIRTFMTDPALFGKQFGGKSWAAWRALMAGFYGLLMDEEELALFGFITALPEAPQRALLELWLVIGRRGGKSIIAALLAVYEGCFNDHRSKLSPGEIATILVLAADRKQARTVMRYIRGLLHSNPMLKRMIINEGKESIELNNRCVIEVGTASFRSVRGYTLAAVIADEVAFWRSDESANPDTEILNALRPALATLDGKLICLSSPYSKRGAMWNAYQRYYGKPGNILVAQAESRTMNPELPQRIVDEAMERDQAAASAEYLAQFRSDLESYIQREAVEPCVRPGPLEIPYNRQHSYVAFVDPAGGGKDEFTLAIGHLEDDTSIVDVLRAERGVPASIVSEYAMVLRAYGLTECTGDRYGGSWPSDEFQKHGIRYQPAEQPKSDLYVDLLPRINSQRIELPPDEKLIGQLINLERRTGRSGKDSIDHGPGGSDDRANVIAGVATLTAKPKAVTVRRKAVYGGSRKKRLEPGPLGFTYNTTAADIQKINWKVRKL